MSQARSWEQPGPGKAFGLGVLRACAVHSCKVAPSVPLTGLSQPMSQVSWGEFPHHERSLGAVE